MTKLLPKFVMLAAIAATAVPTSRATAEDTYLETQVKLATPKKDSSRSREGGLEHVPFRVWLPDDANTIRGLIFDPMYTNAVTQEHWQTAGRHHPWTLEPR